MKNKIKNILYIYGFGNRHPLKSQTNIHDIIKHNNHICCCWCCEEYFGWMIPWWTVIWEAQENYPWKFTTKSIANDYMEYYFSHPESNPKLLS